MADTEVQEQEQPEQAEAAAPEEEPAEAQPEEREQVRAEEQEQPELETLEPEGRPLATGRRKEAVARVRLSQGTGTFTLNGRSLEDFFPSRTHRMLVTAPLRKVGKEKELDVEAHLDGGGQSGQAGALQHGIARALVSMYPSLRTTLKREGFLSRDPREKERRKYGLKKARKAPQYSKR